MAYLDNNGVLYFWQKTKSYIATAIGNLVIPSKTSDLTNDIGFITSADVPEGASASTATPLMDGTAAVGTSTAFARGDHRHPTDTSRASASDLTSHTGNTTVHITSTERTSWNGKYAKPSGGIPKTDLASAVQTSLGKADTALQEHQDISGKVDKVDGKGLSTNDYTTAEKNKLAAFGSASDYALKTDITGMYKYKGSVAAVGNLPSSGNTTGDVYNVESSGMNYAWNGEAWDALGEIFTITSITNAEIDTICT